MARKRLNAELGDIHVLFEAWCNQCAIPPSEALLGCVMEVLQEPKAFEVHLRAKKSGRIRIDAGDLHDKFIAWCSNQNLKPSAALRTLTIRLLFDAMYADSKQGSLEFDATVTAHTSPVAMHAGKPDTQRERRELRLNQSELAALTAIAGQRRISLQRLILQVLRAYLLKTPAFSAAESTQMGANNLALLRIGNNLNQMARHFNAGGAPGTDSGQASAKDAYMAHVAGEVLSLVTEIRAHVDASSALLSVARERWHIELPA
jgi:hypothetical protein